MPRTIAIGDIHGCAAALAAVLDAIQPQSDDTIVTLGDYIDRGPDSRGVIEQLLALQRRCRLVPLLGNHERVAMNVSNGTMFMAFWLEACGGTATLASYGGKFERIPLEHWRFFERLLPYYETETHAFLHANYLPHIPFAEQPEEVCLWSHLTQIPPPHSSGKTVVVGHTPQMNGEVLDAGHLLCLDTWCCGLGCLTAYDIGSGQKWQAEKGGVLLTPNANVG